MGCRVGRDGSTVGNHRTTRQPKRSLSACRRRAAAISMDARNPAFSFDEQRVPSGRAMKQTVEELCTTKGLKMTAQRRVIARVIDDAHDHPDVPAIYDRAIKVD